MRPAWSYYTVRWWSPPASRWSTGRKKSLLQTRSGRNVPPFPVTQLRAVVREVFFTRQLRSMVKMSPTSKKIIFHELLYRPCLCNRSVFLLQFSPKKQFIVMSIDWDIRCSEGVILADTWFQQIANIFPGSVLVPAGGGHGQNSSCRVKKTSRTTARSWVTGKGGTFPGVWQRRSFGSAAKSRRGRRRPLYSLSGCCYFYTNRAGKCCGEPV